jgi:probable HAF family extracellular repeat protein
MRAQSGPGALTVYNYSDKSYTILDFPGSSDTIATSINNQGLVVGYYQNPGSSHTNGFLYSNGTYTTIDVPGATSTL